MKPACNGTIHEHSAQRKHGNYTVSRTNMPRLQLACYTQINKTLCHSIAVYGTALRASNRERSRKHKTRGLAGSQTAVSPQPRIEFHLFLLQGAALLQTQAHNVVALLNESNIEQHQSNVLHSLACTT